MTLDLFIPAGEVINPPVAGTEELAVFLNELLEAARAGARVTLESLEIGEVVAKA